MFTLVRKGFDKNNIVSYGNMFLIGNGHLGYRGTLEEYSASEMVGLNVVGFYDRYQKKWRESINVANPFHVLLSNDTKTYSVLNEDFVSHEVALDIKHAIFRRKTEFDDIIISSERFISQVSDNLLCFKYDFICRKDMKLTICAGMDKNIYEINGPHFKKTVFTGSKRKVVFKATTNEKKNVKEEAFYKIPGTYQSFNDGMLTYVLEAKQNKKYSIYCFSRVEELNKEYEAIPFSIKRYNSEKKAHIRDFEKKWEIADVIIKGNKEAQFDIRYSIYHLLILGNEHYSHSIPARGVSGEVYKGAIFWDTEIFLLPFFTLTNKKIARQLLMYRINTLSGALNKAKEYGYEGAFYAWESQESGNEGCSKYNVTDPLTNKPIRTYFNEKQIHISADITYALTNYVRVANDESILTDGGLNMMCEIVNFFMSYAHLHKDGKYHLDDVIGPDEYHERVDDNAFTSYMAYNAIKETIYYIKKLSMFTEKLPMYENFLNQLYIPEISKDNLIEQFRDYYKKEDCSVDTVRSRLKNPKDYWGTKNGVAYNTRVIKQADVVTLLVLLNNKFTSEVKKANFEFYYPYTEHGSSLSSSMYSILASQIGKTDIAYDMFIKSANIDLGTNQKMFAGGIYIGGTHPASNAGAYLSLVYGMAGLNIENNRITLNPNLPKKIKGLEFRIVLEDIVYRITVDKDNTYRVIKEA